MSGGTELFKTGRASIAFEPLSVPLLWRSVPVSGKVEYDDLPRSPMVDADRRLFDDFQCVSGTQGNAVDAHFASRNVHIPTSPFAQIQSRILGAIEQARKQSRVLMNDHRPVGPFRRGDQPQSAAFFRLREMLLLIARFDAEHARLHPDLKKMHGGTARRVEFAMKDAGNRAHALDVARRNDRYFA